MSYLSAGGPAGTETVLLIHGVGVSARSWIHQLQGLAGTLRVPALDLPGHGESAPIRKPSVEGFILDALGTGAVWVAGHSLAACGGRPVRRRPSNRGVTFLRSPGRRGSPDRRCAQRRAGPRQCDLAASGSSEFSPGLIYETRRAPGPKAASAITPAADGPVRMRPVACESDALVRFLRA